MLLSVMLDVRAWALARPLIEQENARVQLSDQLREIENTQEEQGMFSFFGRTIKPILRIHAWSPFQSD